VVVHVLDGMKLDVDRGPNWLFVKLRPRGKFAKELPELADRLMAIASRHFIYRVVLELEELRSMPAGLIEQLKELQQRLAECGGALRLCGLSIDCARTLQESDMESALPNHETRQAAVLGCDAAALHQRLKEIAASAAYFETDDERAAAGQQPCLQ